VIRTNKAESEALIASQNQSLQKQIKEASQKAMLTGAIIGGCVGLLAAVISKLI